ncbi:MAG: hypothetical protein JSU74_06850, partial [Candidatus Zixiibacteriota bacterium]
IISFGTELWRGLEAAHLLSKEGIDVRVINMSTLKPLDEAATVAKTSSMYRCIRAHSIREPVLHLISTVSIIRSGLAPVKRSTWLLSWKRSNRSQSSIPE